MVTGPRAGCGPSRGPASSGPQPKSAYPEWRRDRPVEATTTYRREVGKVPTPGRSSCEIRDTPVGGPRSDQVAVASMSGPFAALSRQTGDACDQPNAAAADQLECARATGRQRAPVDAAGPARPPRRPAGGADPRDRRRDGHASSRATSSTRPTSAASAFARPPARPARRQRPPVADPAGHRPRRSTPRYLDAGADIIETNTFTATRIAQADYGLDAASSAR